MEKTVDAKGLKETRVKSEDVSEMGGRLIKEDMVSGESKRSIHKE